eukprot:472224-Pyramimonas_sp.AAC.2
MVESARRVRRSRRARDPRHPALACPRGEHARHARTVRPARPGASNSETRALTPGDPGPRTRKPARSDPEERRITAPHIQHHPYQYDFISRVLLCR